MTLPHSDLVLPDSLRHEFHAPLGEFYRVEQGRPSPEERVAALVRENPHAPVVVVGDLTAKTLVGQGVRPDILVLDGKTHRKDNVRVNLSPPSKTHEVANPPGRITVGAWKLIAQLCNSLSTVDRSGKRVSVVWVIGEEDLLVLPAVLESPEGTLVLYGQPPMVGDGGSGIVVVEVHPSLKARLQVIIEGFDRV